MLGNTFLDYLGVTLGISAPVTQTTSTERQLLTNYLPGKKAIVEVGVFEGFTTRELADASDTDATVYGIDPFFTGLQADWARPGDSQSRRLATEIISREGRSD
jgi:hypothetical protein